MDWWWLGEWIRGGAIERDAWDTWLCASMVLGVQFGLVTVVLTTFDLLDPRWWRAKRLKSTVRPATVTIGRVCRMLPTVLLNALVGLVFSFLVWNIRFGLDTSSDNSSTADRWYRRFSWQMVAAIELIVINALSQVWFWSVHRMVHSCPVVFRFVHAAHHVHYEPFALTATDCTVSEMVLLNLPAVILPLVIVQPTLLVQCIWMILAPTYVVFAHSGHYILNDNDAYHAIHHRDLNVNFGSIILDKIAHTFKPE